MRCRFLIFGLVGLVGAAQASSTLRVGSQVLAAGDSAVRVTELLGKPSYKSHRSGSRGSRSLRGGGRGRRTGVVSGGTQGERWQYRRGSRVITVTVVDGRVADIEDRQR
ncbi:MAG: DUF2845 domain-containing protein [Xanthomonadaceae bacterium]|jgi:hypothetical protein|nr:DUF2845 domain-containing protein [Xanthomonadaceae bacterium]MDE3072689.1 DUF2845 domain-containing protein [Pseudomonadota bacterium]